VHRSDPDHLLPCSAAELVAECLQRDRRVLLFGPSGSGKTTLARALAAELAAHGRAVQCLGADPGLPDFGAPGCLSLADWIDDAWVVRTSAALCSLDAARFRLPLIAAAGALAARAAAATLLVDAPGVVRGVAGAELLASLVGTLAVDLILVLHRPGQAPPLAAELNALGVELAWVRVSEQARRPGAAARARQRTRLWELHLAGGAEHVVSVDALQLLGTPPRKAAEAWQGKQIAFLQRGLTASLGEALGFDGARLRVCLPPGQIPTDTLLVRDACRGRDGRLGTAAPFAAERVHYVPPSDVLASEPCGAATGVRPVVQLGTVVAGLLNGVFGDPLLHLRLGQQRRSLLFDLGEGARLPARVAHQVTDVFISHAHADHIGGFLSLLRARIGETGVCRLYGPPGLAKHVASFIAGILWDRIGAHGPVFEVSELHGDGLRRVRLRAGAPEAVALADRPVAQGVLLEESGFCVRCVQLDHGTPVLAFAFQAAVQITVREERLRQRGLAPGPWLTTLKQRIGRGDVNAQIDLPDGTRQTVAELAADLTRSAPGTKLVYATDFADTPANRQRLVALAADADCLFCEASFLERDRNLARRTGHLTARACAEIATAARVRLLIPFHFSRRYEREPWRVYAEIAAACPQVVIPKSGSLAD
jgi:ribonuclease BN (tRNA processing enzyme)